MRHDSAEHACNMPKPERGYLTREAYFTKHAHLPRSIWAVRVVWSRGEGDDLKVVVDVEQCPGCCDGLRKWTTISVGTIFSRVQV